MLLHVFSRPALSQGTAIHRVRARTSAKVAPSNEALTANELNADAVFGSVQVGSPSARRQRSFSKEQVGSPQVVSPERRRSGSLPSVLTRDMAIDLSNFIYTKPALRITGRWAPPRF